MVVRTVTLRQQKKLLILNWLHQSEVAVFLSSKFIYMRKLQKSNQQHQKQTFHANKLLLITQDFSSAAACCIIWYDNPEQRKSITSDHVSNDSPDSSNSNKRHLKNGCSPKPSRTNSKEEQTRWSQRLPKSWEFALSHWKWHTQSYELRKKDQHFAMFSVPLKSERQLCHHIAHYSTMYM